MTNELIPVSDEQSKAVQQLSTFGKTVVEAGEKLAGYVGRVLGTLPEDAVGLVIGDPLRFVRTAIAAQYDALVTKILTHRGVKAPQPVAPALAIPLLRAAYDENRPELQELWARLLASAMDPNRSGRVRLSFVTALNQFDPLDARVLKQFSSGHSIAVTWPNFMAQALNVSLDEATISVENLIRLGCLLPAAAESAINTPLRPFGRELLRCVSD